MIWMVCLATWIKHILDILKENQIDVIIDGMINNVLRMMIEAMNIKIISFVYGETNEILNTFNNGNIICKKYFLPGTCRYRKRFGKKLNN